MKIFSKNYWIPTFVGMAMLFFAVPANAALGPDDNLIVPGERVGMITKDTTEAELIAKLGKKNVKREVYNEGEGVLSCVSVLFKDTPKELRIGWRNVAIYDRIEEITDKELDRKCQNLSALNKIEYLIIRGSKADERISDWQTIEGLRIGLNVTDVNRINQAPIDYLINCECCGEGGIQSWNGGIYDEIYNKTQGGYLEGIVSYNYDEVGLSNKINKAKEKFFENEENLHPRKTSMLPKEIEQKIFLQELRIYFVENND